MCALKNKDGYTKYKTKRTTLSSKCASVQQTILAFKIVAFKIVAIKIVAFKMVAFKMVAFTVANQTTHLFAITL